MNPIFNPFLSNTHPTCLDDKWTIRSLSVSVRYNNQEREKKLPTTQLNYISSHIENQFHAKHRTPNLRPLSHNTLNPFQFQFTCSPFSPRFTGRHGRNEKYRLTEPKPNTKPMTDTHRTYCAFLDERTSKSNKK